jgi:hypothetical protein
MLLIDMLTATMMFIQRDNGGCVKFPILPFSAFSWASRQSTALYSVTCIANYREKIIYYVKVFVFTLNSKNDKFEYSFYTASATNHFIVFQIKHKHCIGYDWQLNISLLV